VEKLSISSNCIDKIVNFPPLKYITRLSLARNNIKKISGLEEIAGSLKELWLSYNQVEKLEGLSMCMKLTTLFIGSKSFFTQIIRLRVGTSSTSSENCLSSKIRCSSAILSTNCLRTMLNTMR
jgi:hypothetical protein